MAALEATRVFQFIANNHALFHLKWNENLLNHQKISKYYEHDCRSSSSNIYQNFKDTNFPYEKGSDWCDNISDNMLLTPQTLEELLMSGDAIIFVLIQLGFVISLKKSILASVQKIEFLGLEIQ